MMYFVDFENVGTTGLEGLETLTGRDCVVLFVSDHTTEKGMLKRLSETKARIRIEYVSTTAKNAMDFCLISSVGAEIAKGKKSLCIVSGDKGYDAARTFWNERGISVRSLSSISGKSQKQKVTVSALPAVRSEPVKKLPKNAEGLLGQFLKDNFEDFSKNARKNFRKALIKESGADCQKMLIKLKVSEKKAAKTENFLISNGIRQISEK